MESVPKARQARKAFIGRLSRPESSGFRRLFASSFTTKDVFSKGGIFLGAREAFRFDAARLYGVVERVVRALYWHEFETRIRRGYQIRAVLDQFGEGLARDLAGKLNWPAFTKVAGGNFWYTFNHGERDPMLSVWLLVFYEQVGFVVTVGKPRSVAGAGT